MEGEFGGQWIHVYVWLSPFTFHLKISQHCLLIGYTPTQKVKKNKLYFSSWVEGKILKFGGL